MILSLDLGANSYDIVLEAGALKHCEDYLNLNRKVLIVTDEGVPAEYAKCVADRCKTPIIATVPQGEGSKSIATYEKLLLMMLEAGFGRKDAVVAVGGGVCGDLAGFVAASYMRGVDFYNIPTTVLSQVDSSIGGKTAVNLGHIKNVVGAFYQPKKVLVDVDTLKTLEKRHIAEGLAEAVKMSLTSDAALFEMFETEEIEPNMERIIEGSLRIKKDVVEQDEKEMGLRRILNFGHTIGHGVESAGQEIGLYHGECVALGMIPMCSEDVKKRLVPVLEKLGLPTSVSLDPEAVYEALLHDKKASAGTITIVKVNAPGTFELETVDPASLKTAIAEIVK